MTKKNKRKKQQQKKKKKEEEEEAEEEEKQLYQNFSSVKTLTRPNSSSHKESVRLITQNTQFG